MSPHSADPASDPHIAAALAQAERRRIRLVELGEIGINLACGVGAHAAAAMSAINEDNGGDPTRAFATVSRSVRLTVAMEARVDAVILALRKGRMPAGWVGAGPAPRAGSPARGHAEEPHGESPGALRENQPEFDRERLVEYERPDLPDLRAGFRSADVPSVFVAAKAADETSALRAGVEREIGRPGKISEERIPEHRAIPSTRSRPEGGSRPPRFGGGTDPPR